MSIWIPIAIAVILVLAAGLAIYLVRSRGPAPPPLPVEESPDDLAARRARQQAINTQGTELLQRRIELDSKRGTLGGDWGIDEAFKDLEDRLRSGEIDEAQFEREKIKLLGG